MKNKVLPSVISFITLLSFNLHAALIDRGNGLIYDDVLDVTWLQNANLANTKMNWEDSLAWADSLSFAGFDDWRLPSLTHSVGPNNDKTDLFVNCGNGRFDMDMSGCDFGWNSTSVTHELAYMFSVNIGNQATVDSTGSFNVNGGLLNVSAPDAVGGSITFSNVQASSYWYGNEFSDQQSFFFAMHTGGQFILDKSTELFAWALRDGDVRPTSAATFQQNIAQIPEPSSAVLMSMLLLLLAYRTNNPFTTMLKSAKGRIKNATA